MYPKVLGLQVETWLHSDHPTDSACALAVTTMLLYCDSPQLAAVLTHATSSSERVRTAALVALHDHVIDPSREIQASPYHALVLTLREFLAQEMASVLMSEMRTPSLAMFTVAGEGEDVRVVAFNLLTLLKVCACV